MAAKQVYEIVEYVESVHRELEAILTQAREHTNHYQWELAVEYLRQRETNTQDVLKRLNVSTRQQVLNSYIRYYPIEIEKEIQQRLDRIRGSQSFDPVQEVIGIKQQLVTLVSACNNSVSLPDVQQLFEEYAEYERSQLQRYGRRAVELKQEYSGNGGGQT
ncbi:MAG: hypothetical protein SV765_02845 [Pseudomonadota bacterium]|mgnify:CR=1 FL=1|nr:hypothetical protein [Pseudomonadales bacterium]MDY6919133.1 hypothetical protein [Pseudomonadota bacterium]